MLSIAGLYHTSPAIEREGVHLANCDAASVLSQSFSLKLSASKNESGLLMGVLSDVPMAVTPLVVLRTQRLLMH